MAATKNSFSVAFRRYIAQERAAFSRHLLTTKGSRENLSERLLSKRQIKTLPVATPQK